ncbi:YbgA family protein [Erysipelothrix urinaevulpis]
MNDLKYWLRQDIQYYIMHHAFSIHAHDFSKKEIRQMEDKAYRLINLSGDAIITDLKVCIIDQNKSYSNDLQLACRERCIETKNLRLLEQEWARYKYYVMSKHQNTYNYYRNQFRRIESINIETFYRDMDLLSGYPENIAANVNTLEHIWGYFKQKASTKEKETWLNLVSAYQKKNQSLFACKDYIHHLLSKYPSEYLSYSYYLIRNIA